MKVQPAQPEEMKTPPNLRDDLTEKVISYPPRNRWKADLRWEGECLVKDYGRAPLIPRFFGRFLSRWEKEALIRLRGVEGVPFFVEAPTTYSVKMKGVPGIPLSKLKRGDLNEAFLDGIISLFETIHRRGVAHGDAHGRNVLVHDQRPYLIDFSTAYVKGRFPIIDHYVFNCFVLLDQERIYKIKKEFFGIGEPPRMFFLYRVAKGRRG
jgi:RIO1 family